MSLGTWSTWGRSVKHPTPTYLDGLPFHHQLLAQPQASDGSDDWSMLFGGTCNPSPDAECQREASCCGRAGVIIEELNAFPCWIEAREDLLAPGLQRVLERFLNAILETHYEMFHVVPDAVFSTIANRVAEACLRCQFRRAANSPVIASATPPGTSQGTGDLCPQHRQLGFGPAHDPNLHPISYELLPSLILRRPTWLALPLWASLQGRLLVRPLMGTMRMLRAGTWATDSHDWHCDACCAIGHAWRRVAAWLQQDYVVGMSFAWFDLSTWPLMPRCLVSYESWKKRCAVMCE